ncbi:MAG: HEPN domain-containing protein [Dehalococcoidia bacterium]
MAQPEPVFLDKAVESLAGAASEHNNGRYNNAANRAYYATFQAAVFALEDAGLASSGPRPSWSHEGVQALFARELITRRKVYPAEFRDILSRNYLLRQTADYARDIVSETQATRTLRRTREFVHAIAQRGGGRQ